MFVLKHFHTWFDSSSTCWLETLFVDDLFEFDWPNGLFATGCLVGATLDTICDDNNRLYINWECNCVFIEKFKNENNVKMN